MAERLSKKMDNPELARQVPSPCYSEHWIASGFRHSRHSRIGRRNPYAPLVAIRFDLPSSRRLRRAIDPRFSRLPSRRARSGARPHCQGSQSAPVELAANNSRGLRRTGGVRRRRLSPTWSSVTWSPFQCRNSCRNATDSPFPCDSCPWAVPQPSPPSLPIASRHSCTLDPHDSYTRRGASPHRKCRY